MRTPWTHGLGPVLEHVYSSMHTSAPEHVHGALLGHVYSSMHTSAPWHLQRLPTQGSHGLSTDSNLRYTECTDE